MINKVVDNLIKRMDLGWLVKKPEKKKSVFKEFMNDPDSFVLTAYVEDEEIKISFKKKAKDEEA